MDIEIFTICDFAQVNQDKMTIVGTFNTLSSGEFPLKASFYIALRIRFDKINEGNYNIEFSIEDYNNKAIVPKFQVPANIHSIKTESHVYQLAISLNDLNFIKPGVYSFNMAIANISKSIPLYVTEINLKHEL